MVAFFAEFASATLVALFYSDTNTCNCGSCLTSDIDTRTHSEGLSTSLMVHASPFIVNLWQLHCETVLSAPRRSSHRLAAVPRPGYAGKNSTVIFKKERHTSAKDSAIKRSACGWSIPARRRWRLPAHKREAVARLSRDKPATDLRLFIPHSPQGP